MAAKKETYSQAMERLEKIVRQIDNILQITVKIHPLVFIITFLLYSMTGNKDKRLWLDNK